MIDGCFIANRNALENLSRLIMTNDYLVLIELMVLALAKLHLDDDDDEGKHFFFINFLSRKKREKNSFKSPQKNGIQEELNQYLSSLNVDGTPQFLISNDSPIFTIHNPSALKSMANTFKIRQMPSTFP